MSSRRLLVVTQFVFPLAEQRLITKQCEELNYISTGLRDTHTNLPLITFRLISRKSFHIFQV